MTTRGRTRLKRAGDTIQEQQRAEVEEEEEEEGEEDDDGPRMGRGSFTLDEVNSTNQGHRQERPSLKY